MACDIVAPQRGLGWAPSRAAVPAIPERRILSSGAPRRVWEGDEASFFELFSDWIFLCRCLRIDSLVGFPGLKIVARQELKPTGVN